MSNTPNTRKAFRGIVQLALLPEHVESIKAYMLEMDKVWTAIDQMLLDGYEVTLLYNAERSQYTARVWASDRVKSANQGYQFYANAPSVDGVMASVVVKHFFVAEDGLWANASTTPSSDFS